MELNTFLAEIFSCEPDMVYKEIEKLLDGLVRRTPLHEYGMKEEEIRSFAESVEKSQQTFTGTELCEIRADDLEKIYRKLY